LSIYFFLLSWRRTDKQKKKEKKKFFHCSRMIHTHPEGKFEFGLYINFIQCHFAPKVCKQCKLVQNSVHYLHVLVITLLIFTLYISASFGPNWHWTEFIYCLSFFIMSHKTEIFFLLINRFFTQKILTSFFFWFW
jgi:hypothetical protein